jgi:histidyl-tRNA synthetase
MFRHERPQRGATASSTRWTSRRSGFEGPDVDAEQIVMLARLWKRSALPASVLQINSIGDRAQSDVAHRNDLIAYLRAQRRRARRRREAPAARQSLAHPRQQESRDAGR